MSKRRCILTILITILLVMIYHLQKELFKLRLEDLVKYESETDLGVRDPSVSCRFPLIHPFDSSILRYVSIANPIRCATRNELLTYIDDKGIIRFNITALKILNQDQSSIKCTYKEILRLNDFEITYGPELPLTGNEKPNSDYVKVECKLLTIGFQTGTYTNFHAYAQRNSTVRKFTNTEELGIAVIGIDSLSRLNFMRQLPKTYKLITGLLGGVIMYGFNKVGENTLPNVVPMLTGKRPPKPPFNKFKGWPFMWKLFASKGAATIYSEDCPDINMFDYLEAGIDEQPTHHYMRTFWLAVEDSLQYKMSSTYCLGPLPKHVIFYEYLKSFLRTYKDSPVFLFSLINELIHDYVNTIGAIDDDLVSFFNSSYHEGLFNRTVVFLLGDHGNRLDPIRRTEVGKIEDCMPLVSVIIPPWVKKFHPEWTEALRKNRNRLTSTFDVHKTFSDILGTLSDHEPNEDDEQKRFSVDDSTEDYFKGDGPGISLFKTIPAERDCKDAGIPDIYCVCEEGDKIDPKDNRSVQAAKKVIDFFNNVELKDLENCEVISLISVDSAVLKRKKEGKEEIQIRFTTDPGRGMFESMVALSKSSISIMGETLRINVYGDQASCLPHEIILKNPKLRGICYCK